MSRLPISDGPRRHVILFQSRFASPVEQCDCDIGEAPSAYRATRPISKKACRCSECGEAIQRGERYERVFAIWDGEAHICKTCVYCLAARDLIESACDCFCWSHYRLLELATDRLAEIKGTRPGLAFAVGRIIIEGRRARRANRASDAS